MPGKPPDFSKLNPLLPIYEKFPEYAVSMEQDLSGHRGMGDLYYRLRRAQEAALRSEDLDTAQKAKESAETVMQAYAQRFKHLMTPDLYAPESKEIFKKVANNINASEKITDPTDPRYVAPEHVLKKAFGGTMLGWDNAKQAILKHPLEDKVDELLKPYLKSIPMGPASYRYGSALTRVTHCVTESLLNIFREFSKKDRRQKKPGND
jgi:hypothetical protein